MGSAAIGPGGSLMPDEGHRAAAAACTACFQCRMFPSWLLINTAAGSCIRVTVRVRHPSQGSESRIRVRLSGFYPLFRRISFRAVAAVKVVDCSPRRRPLDCSGRTASPRRVQPLNAATRDLPHATCHTPAAASQRCHTAAPQQVCPGVAPSISPDALR